MILKSFFIELAPDIPTLTHQHGLAPRANGKGLYKISALRALEKRYRSALAKFAPEHPYDEPLVLFTQWFFRRPLGNTQTWKTTRPDTENLIKTLKDCMTTCGFWKDDSFVVREVTEKGYVNEREPVGIYIEVEQASKLPFLHPLAHNTDASLF